MSQYTLVLLEVTGIQSYIFGSNQLAQNIGASELVARSTTEWVADVLYHLDLDSNIRWDADQGLVLHEVEQDEPAFPVEAIYAGGGNAMLLFREQAAAVDFMKVLTHRTLEDASGLQLVGVQERFEWNSEEPDQQLTAIHERARRNLAARKLNRAVSTPLLGLSVTAAGVYTGLPAVGFDNDPRVVGRAAAEKMQVTGAEPRLISQEVADKLRAEDQGKERLHTVLHDEVRAKGFEFVYDFDQFGTKGESSYIAVIHADGNAMGDRFDSIARRATSNRDYITQLHRFSDSIKRNAQDALEETVRHLLNNLDPNGRTFAGEIPVPTREHLHPHRLLPFRPIVFGGDDVTFVCDGRLGLPLAAKYLEAFTRKPLSDGKEVYARAGVAVVKSHFPFSRAYDLAADLARTAKRSIEDLKLDGEDSATVVDWHFSTTGVIRTLEDIRRLEYTADTGNCLLARPIRAGGPSHDGQWRNWDEFARLVVTFKQGENWAGRRNKLIAMRNALRGGPSTFQLFCNNYRIPKQHLPEIPGQDDMQTDGWQDKRCGYFDAIEAVDFFVSLEPETRKEAT